MHGTWNKQDDHRGETNEEKRDMSRAASSCSSYTTRYYAQDSHVLYPAQNSRVLYGLSLPRTHVRYTLPRTHVCYTLPRTHACYTAYTLPRTHVCYTLPRTHVCYTLPRTYVFYSLPRTHVCYTLPRTHVCYALNLCCGAVWQLYDGVAGVYLYDADGAVMVAYGLYHWPRKDGVTITAVTACNTASSDTGNAAVCDNCCAISRQALRNNVNTLYHYERASPNSRDHLVWTVGNGLSHVRGVYSTE